MTTFNPCYKPEKLNLNANRATQATTQNKLQKTADKQPGLQIEGRLKLWLHNWRTRRQLAQLDSAALKDLGLSRADALNEADKPFWH
ncbi:DUF1127 domain-containing protein [Aliamphritea ceti]|uniref:DUF1127 domain-containing protein n=1 Tax=Aliamphritea ceti TaxID=1524258 RepID=UPI0021C31FB1|nr:DUF1127 domain-containing protein [Aliamphritea ceti]